LSKGCCEATGFINGQMGKFIMANGTLARCTGMV